MTRVTLKDATIGVFGRVILERTISKFSETETPQETGAYIFLLLVDVADLEPNIFFR